MIEPHRLASPACFTYWLSNNALNAFSIRDARGSASLAASEAGAETDAPEADGKESPSLEDAARKEREYLRERLRDELKREPGEEELNEWLRRHTEGY